MPQQPSSEALHIALRSGAEVGLARALAHGDGSEQVTHFVEHRLSDLLSSDLDYIKHLASRILSAAEYVTETTAEEPVDLSKIPTNDELFGDDWGGRRLFWFGEWNIPGTEEWYKFSGTLPDITTQEDITDYAQELAMSYIEAYPARFKQDPDELPDEVTVRILGIEKRF